MCEADRVSDLEHRAATTANRPSRPNQPWRGFVAGGEIALAAVAVLAGVLCWRNGIGHMVTPLGDGHPPLESTVFYGNWISGAIGLVAVGAFLLLDAFRQITLAVQARRRPPPPAMTVAAPPAAG